MSASPYLRRSWNAASDLQFARVLAEARAAVPAFAAVTAERGSLLQSWIAGREVLQFDHYPPDDLVDLRHGSQFYYHSHRDGDKEHGHVHVFWHATASGRRRYLRPGRPRWTRTAPTHLFAISLDARGLPVALFTVNQWVTDGHWLDARTTLACVDQFAMGELQGHEHSCRWLTGFVRLYRPLVEELLVRRDRRLARRVDLARALQDRKLELLSFMRIDWIADMQALEAEYARRASRKPVATSQTSASVSRYSKTQLKGIQ